MCKRFQAFAASQPLSSPGLPRHSAAPSMTQPGHALGGSLLPWVVTSEQTVRPAETSGSGGGGGVAPVVGERGLRLSLVDRIAAPTAFMHQALVFERTLDAERLRSALAEALTLLPTLACRATKDEVCSRGGGCREANASGQCPAIHSWPNSIPTHIPSACGSDMDSTIPAA